MKHSNIIAHRIANSIINEKDEGKEESQIRLSDNNKPLVEDLHINENSGRGSSPDQRITPKPDTSKIVDVAIPRHSLRGSESSQTPSLTSSHCDIKRQETDLGNSCESLRNVKMLQIIILTKIIPNQKRLFPPRDRKRIIWQIIPPTTLKIIPVELKIWSRD